MAKRGYTRDTVRGGASEWDVSRPFSSYVRLLASLLAHPVRFFEVLPKIPDARAPGMFLIFTGIPSAILWYFTGGIYAAIAALLLPLPLSFGLAALYHLGVLGNERYGYLITWRIAAYPLGFYLPLSAIPVVRWVIVPVLAVLIPLGLTKAQEVSTARAIPVAVVAGLLTMAALVAPRLL